MRPLFFSSLFLALTLCSATAGIDFTPDVDEYVSQGIKYTKVKLKTDTGYASFVPPAGWVVRGATDSLQMQPANKNFVEISATAKRGSKAAPFDEATVEALKNEVLATVPACNPPAEIVSSQQSVVAGVNPNLEIVVSYNALGRYFQRSVIFVSTPDEQLRFRLTAPKAEFAALNEAFRQTLNSWNCVEQKASSGNNAVAAASRQASTQN